MSNPTALLLAALLALAACSHSPTAPSQQGSGGFRDCEACPEMVSVPAGRFTMGASLEEEERHGMTEASRGRSIPLHEVRFERSFAMGRYPVTVAEFRSFVEETGYRAPEACTTQHRYDGHFIYERANGYTWRAPGFPQSDRHPVVCISAYDAQAYADWLSEKTGHDYTLPSEAQYEYALRAGTTTSFFWGDDRDARACKYSNQPDFEQAAALGNVPTGPEYRFQCSDGYAWTSPVGSFEPNPWGLYDMQGNIWEWTADCWNEDYRGAPGDGSTWTEGDCDARPSGAAPSETRPTPPTRASAPPATRATLATAGASAWCATTERPEPEEPNMDARLQELLDHHEIRKTLAEYCHACDRGDAELMASVYSGDDSFDDHGAVKAPGPEYARVMTGMILEQTESISHILGQSLIEVDGDTARAETFVVAFFRTPASPGPDGSDGPPGLNVFVGRFVDRLQRIDSSWKIKHRTCVRDNSISLSVESDAYADLGFVAGTRDSSDLGAALLALAHQR